MMHSIIKLSFMGSHSYALIHLHKMYKWYVNDVDGDENYIIPNWYMCSKKNYEHMCELNPLHDARLWAKLSHSQLRPKANTAMCFSHIGYGRLCVCVSVVSACTETIASGAAGFHWTNFPTRTERAVKIHMQTESVSQSSRKVNVFDFDGLMTNHFPRTNTIRFWRHGNSFSDNLDYLLSTRIDWNGSFRFLATSSHCIFFQQERATQELLE